MCHGRPSRKGGDVIWSSQIRLEDLVGVWDTSTPGDGGMQNYRMVLKSDGLGSFTEAGPAWAYPIWWYVEDDVLYINKTDRNICTQKIKYTADIIVPSMTKEVYHFTELLAGAYGQRYYREIMLSNTLEDWEAEAATAYSYMAENNPDFHNL